MEKTHRFNQDFPNPYSQSRFHFKIFSFFIAQIQTSLIQNSHFLTSIIPKSSLPKFNITKSRFPKSKIPKLAYSLAKKCNIPSAYLSWVHPDPWVSKWTCWCPLVAEDPSVWPVTSASMPDALTKKTTIKYKILFRNTCMQIKTPVCYSADRRFSRVNCSLFTVKLY